MRKNKGRLSQAITTIDVAAEAKHGEKNPLLGKMMN